MRVYIIRRLLLVVPTVFVASLIIFFTIRSLPGNIVDLMVAQFGQYGNVNKSDIESELGLNVPIITQYGRWIGVTPQPDGHVKGILEGNFGASLWETTR